MTRPALSTIVIGASVVLLVGVLCLVLGPDALAQGRGGTPDLKTVGNNTRDQVLGFFTGIVSILFAIRALQHSGDRNVGQAVMSFLFLMIAAYFILVPDSGKDFVKATAQRLLNGGG